LPTLLKTNKGFFTLQTKMSKSIATIYSKKVPPDSAVLEEVVQAVQSNSGNLNYLAISIYRDVATVFEIIRLANSTQFNFDQDQINDLQTALTRIGWQNLRDIITELSTQAKKDYPAKNRWLESYRSRCRRSGMIARIFAESIAKNLTQEAQTIACFSYFGDMLAVLHLGHLYLELAENHPRNRILYKLSSEYNFDVESVALNYLEKNGLPRQMLEIFNRGLTHNNLARTHLRPIIFSASELVDAYDCGKFARYLELNDLPQSSHLKNLKINRYQFPKVIERIEMYLNSAIQIEKSAKTISESVASKVLLYADNGKLIQNQEQSSLVKETPVDKVILEERTVSASPLSKLNSKKNEGLSQSPKDGATANSFEEEKTPPTDKKDIFDLRNTQQTRHYRRAAKVVYSYDDEIEADDDLPVTVGAPSSKIILINKVITIAESSEQLLSLCLEMMTQNSFQNICLLIVNKKVETALILAARGKNIKAGTALQINGEMGPFYDGFSKVISSPTRQSSSSPLGSSTYAVSPLQIDHSLPILLYADCGQNEIISFEARRIFRHIVRSINQRLPRLPGGILMEF
jgi:HD-like signal output (HDOD) protein